MGIIAIREKLFPGKGAESRGFSLIEVVLAMLILTFAILSLAELFILSVKVNNTSRDSTSAASIGAEKMEELKRTPYAELTPGGSLDPEEPVEDFHEMGTGDFLILWKIEADTPIAGVKKINVKTVSLEDQKSRVGKKNVVLITYRVNNED